MARIKNSNFINRLDLWIFDLKMFSQSLTRRELERCPGTRVVARSRLLADGFEFGICTYLNILDLKRLNNIQFHDQSRRFHHASMMHCYWQVHSKNSHVCPPMLDESVSRIGPNLPSAILLLLLSITLNEVGTLFVIFVGSPAILGFTQNVFVFRLQLLTPVRFAQSMYFSSLQSKRGFRSERTNLSNTLIREFGCFAAQYWSNYGMVCLTNSHTLTPVASDNKLKLETFSRTPGWLEVDTSNERLSVIQSLNLDCFQTRYKRYSCVDHQKNQLVLNNRVQSP